MELIYSQAAFLPYKVHEKGRKSQLISESKKVLESCFKNYLWKKSMRPLWFQVVFLKERLTSLIYPIAQFYHYNESERNTCYLWFTSISQCVDATVDRKRLNNFLELIYLSDCNITKKLSIIGRSHLTLLGYLNLTLLAQVSMPFKVYLLLVFSSKMSASNS